MFFIIIPYLNSNFIGRSPSSLMRAHNRFLSQMRATFRALELSPDLARNGISPMNLSSAEVSRNVMESLQQPTSASTESSTMRSDPATASASASASAPPGSSVSGSPSLSLNNTRGELRALSERLEHELRSRRESFGKLKR